MTNKTLANVGVCAVAQTAQIVTTGTPVAEVQMQSEVVVGVESSSASANSSFGLRSLFKAAARSEGSVTQFYRGHHQSRKSMKGSSRYSNMFSSSFGTSSSGSKGMIPVEQHTLKGVMIIKPPGSRATPQTVAQCAPVAQQAFCVQQTQTVAPATHVAFPAAVAAPAAAPASYAPMIDTACPVQVKVEVSVNGCPVPSTPAAAPVAAPAPESVIAAPEAVVASVIPVAAEAKAEAEPENPEVVALPAAPAAVAAAPVAAAPVAPAPFALAPFSPVSVFNQAQCGPQQVQTVNVCGTTMLPACAAPVATPAYGSVEPSNSTPAFVFLNLKYEKKVRASSPSSAASRSSMSRKSKSSARSSKHAHSSAALTSPGSYSSQYSGSESYGSASYSSGSGASYSNSY